MGLDSFRSTRGITVFGKNIPIPGSPHVRTGDILLANVVNNRVPEGKRGREI